MHLSNKFSNVSNRKRIEILYIFVSAHTVKIQQNICTIDNFAARFFSELIWFEDVR